MASTLHTARPVLTPVAERDVTPQVAHWLWDANPVPLQTVADLVTRGTRTFQHAGWWGLWALRPATTSSPGSAPPQPPESRSAPTPTRASASNDPGMLLSRPCSSMDRATDF